MLVILGASGGIGSQLAEHFTYYPFVGSHMIAACREDCDIEKAKSVRLFFANLNRVGDNGPLYVINATGHLVNGTLHNLEDEEIEKTLQVNVAGACRIAREFYNAAATRPSSSLLYLSSVVGRLGVVGAASYGAAKMALHGLVRSAAREFASIGARVNAIEMGYFDTGLIERIPADKLEAIKASIPLRRLGRKEEIGQMCNAVLSNTYMTGSIVTLSGGL